MFLASILEYVPFEVWPSSLFCDIPNDAVFESQGKLYKLLHRDINKVVLVRWNWLTKRIWGGNNGNRRQAAN
jgi:hypothetical protein